jgi:hypothetical protein
MDRPFARKLLVLLVAGLGLVTRPLGACPFCSATSQTFSEELATMDVAVIAKLVKLPPVSDKVGEELQKATFEVVEVLKGDAHIRPRQKIETLYFGEGAIGRPFLVMGIAPPDVMWSTPLPLSERAVAYLKQVIRLPKDNTQRLVFFQQYLEDADEMLTRDAYDEFARAPYAEVKAIKPHLKHDQIVAWIKNPDVPASRRRLYLVMLGIIGSEKDLPMLEEMLRSSDRKAKSGLDALIACYLTLKGEAGLPLIEQLFLANTNADYADTYAAIMALRFHGTEGGVIDTKRLVRALHHMLDRPELADLVIPDLAKWEDWSVIDRLFELYKTANEKNSWVRVPVINYLRACPLPRAKELLQECEKIDPAAVKRANTFFPGAPAAPTPPPNKDSQLLPGQGELSRLATASRERTSVAGRLAQVEMARNGPSQGGESLAAAINPGAESASAVRIWPLPANRWLVLGVPSAVGLLLVVAQWSLLCRHDAGR